MGNKTDRIRELEGNLEAARVLLRNIGDAMGVELDTATTVSETLPLHRNFLNALRAKTDAPVKGVTEVAVPRPRAAPAAPGSWDTFDQHVDDQIDRLAEQGLTAPRGDGALARSSDFGVSDEQFDDATNRNTSRDIARELGLEVHEDLGAMLLAIYAEILRVKNIGADIAAPSTNKALAKGDTLAQAIEHGHAQASDLRDGATQARAIVSRIAAVMQIPVWDKDGTELLERAQRWEGWKHELKARIRWLRGGYSTPTLRARDVPDEHAATELQVHLDRLLSPKELADWLKANQRAGEVKVDAGPLVAPYPFEFRAGDVVPILAALESRADVTVIEKLGSTRTEGLVTLFRDISMSRVSTDEFTRTMNVVILPILARQRAAQRLPEDATRPTE